MVTVNARLALRPLPTTALIDRLSTARLEVLERVKYSIARAWRQLRGPSGSQERDRRLELGNEGTAVNAPREVFSECRGFAHGQVSVHVERRSVDELDTGDVIRPSNQ